MLRITELLAPGVVDTLAPVVVLAAQLGLFVEPVPPSPRVAPGLCTRLGLPRCSRPRRGFAGFGSCPPGGVEEESVQ